MDVFCCMIEKSSFYQCADKEYGLGGIESGLQGRVVVPSPVRKADLKALKSLASSDGAVQRAEHAKMVQTAKTSSTGAVQSGFLKEARREIRRSQLNPNAKPWVPSKQRLPTFESEQPPLAPERREAILNQIVFADFARPKKATQLKRQHTPMKQKSDHQEARVGADVKGQSQPAVPPVTRQEAFRILVTPMNRQQGKAP